MKAYDIDQAQKIIHQVIIEGLLKMMSPQSRRRNARKMLTATSANGISYSVLTKLFFGHYDTRLRHAIIHIIS